MRAGAIVAAAAAAGAMGLSLACSAQASPPGSGHAVHATSSATTGDPGSTASPASPASPPPDIGKPTAGLVPAQLEQAYNLGPLWRRGINGAHQTIVIVDSFGSPTMASDLAAFDQAFGLQPPASLRIIQPTGKVAPYQATSTRIGWASETTLDVEWAHAMAPAAGILLVETPTAENEGRTGFPQIVAAESYVIRHHLGQVISQSFGATEETFRSAAVLRALRGAYQLAARPAYAVTVLAASGDSAASGDTYNMQSLYPRRVVEWPATDPLVTAVGGTFLNLGRSGQRLAPDVAWSNSGGGQSAVFTRPAYQDSVRAITGPSRGIPDISMDASCASSVALYASFPGAGASHWQTICGTSMATPLFAGVVALADQVAGHSLGLINPAIYRMSAARDPGIVDIVSGNNSIVAGGHPVTGFRAGPGYDLVSGVGTVNAAYFVPELARLAG
jgi:subtilase family serine protease